MQFWKVFFAVSASAALLSGCTGINKSNLVGNYKSNNPYCSAQLILKSDRTYKQIVILKSGNRFGAAGQWKFDRTNEQLDLPDGTWVNKDSTTNKINIGHGSIQLPVENYFGNTTIIEDPVDNIFYTKIKP